MLIFKVDANKETARWLHKEFGVFLDMAKFVEPHDMVQLQQLNKFTYDFDLADTENVQTVL